MPKTPRYKIAFIADPIERFDPVAETTFFMMAEVCRRGWECWHVELRDLFLKDNVPHALAKKVHVPPRKKTFTYKITDATELNLATAHAVFLRKDPPVDLNFIDHLTILELLSRQQPSPLLINHPTWIKHANEKLYTLYFKNLAPRTVVAQQRQIIKDFVNREKTAVLKPLNLNGGRGVVKVSANDPSLNSIIDVLTDNQTRYIMAQEYIKEAAQGDKRVILLDGEILGAFLRIPPKGDFRGNLHSGARLTKCTLTQRDHDIVYAIKPTLKRLELAFVGIDIIGPYLTEINCTSAMGLNEINQLENSQSDKIVGNWLQKKLTERVKI